MIDVYVWAPREGAWGHASMYVDNARTGRRNYISFWPQVIACAGSSPISGCNPGATTYEQDCRLEGRPPGHDFICNFTDRVDFNETGILDGWARIKREQPRYAALRHNCCHVVANLLLTDGGGRAHTNFPTPLVWGPRDIIALMRSFPMRVAAAERLAPLGPPPGVRP